MLNNKMRELASIWGYDLQEEFYPKRRKTPDFSYGDIRRVCRIYASN